MTRRSCGEPNSDYSVIQTLEQLNSKDKNHFLTDTYEAMLSQKTINLLFEKFRFNLSLEEIILNTRRLASFLFGKRQRCTTSCSLPLWTFSKRKA